MSRVITCKTLEENPDPSCVYKLTPCAPDTDYYRERTDRNIGWITEDEQEILRNSVIGIAGCGGMGGMLAQIFVRLGIGEVRIADCEEFDTSNINRQYGAGRNTVGVSKAIATARLVRAISDDTTLVVYPQGIVESTVDDFLLDCDIVCDEIEFWAIGSRILLHKHARTHNVSLFNCNTVGFGTHLFLFTPEGLSVEDYLGCSYEQAITIQEKIQTGTASGDDTEFVMERVINGFVPELHGYVENNSDLSSIIKRLSCEGKASIIATNPPMASGFLADHVLLYLLRNSGVTRNIQRPPKIPGFLYFDVANLQAKVVSPGEVMHEK